MKIILLLAAIGLSLCLVYEHTTKNDQIVRLTASLENAKQELRPAYQEIASLTQKYDAEKRDLVSQLDLAKRQLQDAQKAPGQQDAALAEQLRQKTDELTKLQAVFVTQKDEYDKSQKSTEELVQKYEKEKQDLTAQLDAAKHDLENAKPVAAATPEATPKKSWLQEKLDNSPTSLDAKPTATPIRGPRYWVDVYGYRHYY